MNNDINDNKYEKLKDQFTTPTRNVRRNLLVAASLSIVLVLINTKIDGLFGMKFDENVPIFIPIGALYFVVIYEYITFIIYGLSDFKSWHLKPFEKTHQFKESKLLQLTVSLESLSNNLVRSDLSNAKITQHDTGGHPISFHIESVPIGTIIGDEDSKIQGQIQKRINSFIKEQEELLKKIAELEANKFKSQVARKLQSANNNIQQDISNIQSIANTAQSEVSAFQKEIKGYQSGIKGFNIIQRIRIYVIDWGVPLILGSLSLYLNVNSVKLFIMEIGSKLLNI